MSGITRETVLINKLGLHARAAGKLVATASGFDAEIFLHKGDKRVNAKSIMGILMLAAACGTPLTIEAQGSDAEEACTALIALIEGRFGESE